MGHERKFIIGGITDSFSVKQYSKVLESLKQAHPRYTFVDFNDSDEDKKGKKAKKEAPKAFSALIHMLTRKEIDIAVADARIVPLKLQSSISLSSIPARSNPFDVLISNEGIILDDQPEKARLAGINSVRKGQLLYYRPDLQLVEESGSFDDLYEKMKRAEINGFVYAASDVEIMNKQNTVVEVFTSSICMPVAGQGAVGLFTRAEDKECKAVVRILNDPSSAAEIELERMLLNCISRDGKGPIGVLGSLEATEFSVEVTITSPDGLEKVSGTTSGRQGDELKVIEEFAEDLLKSGGHQILKSYRKSSR